MTARLTLVLACLAALLLAAPALAESPVFTAPLKLPKSRPEGTFAGGEPSVAYDPTGDGDVYAHALGGPAAVSFRAWRAGDAPWPTAKAIGSQAGGGDTDVE